MAREPWGGKSVEYSSFILITSEVLFSERTGIEKRKTLFDGAAKFILLCRIQAVVRHDVLPIGLKSDGISGAGDIEKMCGKSHGKFSASMVVGRHWEFEVELGAFGFGVLEDLRLLDEWIRDGAVINEISEAAINLDALANGQANGAVFDKFD
jgi:hypothetical protein